MNCYPVAGATIIPQTHMLCFKDLWLGTSCGKMVPGKYYNNFNSKYFYVCKKDLIEIEIGRLLKVFPWRQRIILVSRSACK